MMAEKRCATCNGEMKPGYVTESHFFEDDCIRELKRQLAHFLETAGAEIDANGDLVFSSKGFGDWTRRKGSAEVKRIVAENEQLKEIIQDFVDFDIREHDNWASPCAYCRLNNRGEGWEEPHADDCVITKARAITVKN
jgi:hypothetical protein